MKKILLIILVVFFSTSIFSQNIFSDKHDTTECSQKSFNIGSHNSGISFGNSPVWNGLRFNFSDCNIKEINGINITFWKPERNPSSVIRGIALGLVPFAGTIKGISLGIVATIAEKKLTGINFGGLATVCNGNIMGINFGGLATVAKGDLTGINIGGLAVVSEGDQFGISFGGLATVAKGELKGINFGGLAVVAENDMTGINVGGLAVVTKGVMKGINFGGLAVVSEGEMTGINSALLALVSSVGVKGLSLVGYKIETPIVQGFNVSLGWCDVEDLTGVSIACYNKIKGVQNGVTIGLFNSATELNGVQIGLINIAKNNSGIFKVLPFINIHFD